ncbi:MAG: hypothetical protein LBS15_00665 [Endomicrobium sp.]|jgi:hypothetical protein|nr:hypothetical protein [Endomicrobium sp.]
MKKVIFILIAMFSLSFVVESVYAQKKDYFVGKWEIEVTGTPSGDTQSYLTLERKDGKLTGSMKFKTEDGQPPIVFTIVEEEGEDKITAYFISQGYDVYLYLKKISEDVIEGSMLDMFEVNGKRIKEEKK